MVLYNITVIIDEEIQEAWMKWVQEVYLPEIMALNFFVSNRILKVLDSPNEGVTYCLQFVADTPDKYSQYIAGYAKDLEDRQRKKFENRYVSFSTLMEFIQ